MKRNVKFQSFVFFFALLIIISCYSSVILSQSLNYRIEQGGKFEDGQILFSPYYGKKTYIIDSAGDINHTWSSIYSPGASTYWIGDGTILRSVNSGVGGTSNGVQKVLWDGTIVWDFRYNYDGYLSHHDIEYLPNGNVLMIAWETRTRQEAIQAGRNPDLIQGDTFKPDQVIEVKPTGPDTGEIVWKWHVWDHLIQDFDNSKDNYGVVGEHPELVDINYGDSFVGDWLHTNSVDYNEEFDQIMVTVHNFNEVWVIDHSTTMEEASGHSGGNSGKGGDLLYRWGNPEAYDAGTNSDQKLFFPHDGTWIEDGHLGEGNMLIFNNGNNRPSGQYSTIDEFIPPVDSNGEYYLEEGSAYGPEDYTWTYTADPPSSFYAHVFGGALRLKDDNTLICEGTSGRFFEVTPDGEIVWEYINEFPVPQFNHVYKIDYIPPEEPPQPEIPDLVCEGSISWTDIEPGETVYGSFQVKNIGDPNSKLNWEITNSPEWGTWLFNPFSGTNLSADNSTNVSVTCVIPDKPNREFTGEIEISNIDNLTDSCSISVELSIPRIKSKEMVFLRLLHRYTNLYQFIEKLSKTIIFIN
ncbi:hypothetical protein AYK21_03765 [Thermoplasmatales archaeon SG8-52-2]|nr:MAG: hypothetical protein AYK21_03765 [Thermoplasmatales archaeon SG8-52-2]